MKPATRITFYVCLRKWLLPLLLSLLLLLMCISSTAGAKKDEKESVPTTKCWECQNYDLVGKYYDQCPMHGKVDPVRAYLGNCTGKCFTHTDDLNKKLIVRGCTSTQWGLPDPLPKDGCYPWYSEVWCVCSSDSCNGVKLGNLTTDKEFDSHIDYTKPKGYNSSNVVYPHCTFFLTLSTFFLMAAIAFSS